MSITKIPPQLRRDVLDRFQVRVAPGKPALYRCAGCGKPFPSTALQMDHIQPEIDSTPEQRLDPANLQPLCNPRGAKPWESCHRKKSAREAAARARLNRVPREWGKPLILAGLSVLPFGYAYADLWPDAVFTPEWWVEAYSWGTVAAFCTFLVHNGFRHRAPLEDNQPDPESGDETEALDTARIVEAAREILGEQGDVRVIRVVGMDDFTLTYGQTKFADHEDEKKLALVNKIQAKIGGRWMPWWDTTRDMVRLTRRPDLPPMIRHPGFHGPSRWNILPFAPDAAFDLKLTTHILIVGTTGAGKTALMRVLIAAAAHNAARDDNTELILADPKLIELIGFRGWAGVRKVVTDTQELWDMAFRLEDEMNERFRLIAAKKVPKGGFKRLIVVIDEYEQYFKRMKRLWLTGKDKDDNKLKQPGQRVPGAIDAIQSVLSMARKCGIHLIIGTQSPDAEWFGGTGTRENLAGRAAVGPVDQYRARMMFDDSSWGRDIPVEAKGRATVQIGDGTPSEVQCFYCADPFDGDEQKPNTIEDWKGLIRVGMPEDMVPDEYKELVSV